MLRITFIIPFFLLAATICGLAAERLTVAYHLPLGVVGGWGAESKKIEGSPPFASRFLKTGDQLLSLAGDYPELIKSGGHAIYNETRSVFVVNATPDQQIELHERFEPYVPIQLQFSFQLVRIPEVLIRLIEDDPKKLPASEVLADLSFLSTRHGVFQVQSSAGDFKVSGEVELDYGDQSSQIMLSLSSAIPESKFEIKTGFATRLGRTHVIPLGSVDGVNSLILLLRHEPVLSSGLPLSTWSETELGQPLPERTPLTEVRKVLLEKNPEWQGKELGLFNAPETSVTFLAPDANPILTKNLPPEMRSFSIAFEKNPFVGRLVELSEIYDVKATFIANGVAFRDGDFTFCQKGTGLLWVKATPINLELIEGVINAKMYTPPVNMEIGLTLVKASKELTQEDLQKKNFKTVRQLMIRGSSGQDMSHLLRDRIKAEAAVMSQDVEGEFLEARVLISEIPADPEVDSVDLVKASMILRKDVPIIIQQSYDGENWLAWIAVARMTIFEDGSKMKTRSSD